MAKGISPAQITAVIQEHRWFNPDTEKGYCVCNDANIYSHHDWAIHIAEVLQAL